MTDTRTFKFWKKEQIVWGYIKDANIILLKKNCFSRSGARYAKRPNLRQDFNSLNKQRNVRQYLVRSVSRISLSTMANNGRRSTLYNYANVL